MRSEARLYSIFDASQCQNRPFMRIYVVTRGGFQIEDFRLQMNWLKAIEKAPKSAI